MLTHIEENHNFHKNAKNGCWPQGSILIILCKLPNLTSEVNFLFVNHHFIILLLDSNFECGIYFNGEVIQMLDGMV
jgi:hypothetical protein